MSEFLRNVVGNEGLYDFELRCSCGDWIRFVGVHLAEPVSKSFDRSPDWWHRYHAVPSGVLMPGFGDLIRSEAEKSCEQEVSAEQG